MKTVSWAHTIALELGATVQPEFIPPGNPNSTTLVVAGRRDTEKVYRAAMCRTVPIVTPEWLQACSDRWERVDEHLFQWKNCMEYFRTVINRHQRLTITDCPKESGLNEKGQQREDSKIISRKRELNNDSSNPKRIKLNDGDTHAVIEICRNKQHQPPSCFMNNCVFLSGFFSVL